jgi:hypothetical protein
MPHFQTVCAHFHCTQTGGLALSLDYHHVKNTQCDFFRYKTLFCCQIQKRKLKTGRAYTSLGDWVEVRVLLLLLLLLLQPHHFDFPNSVLLAMFLDLCPVLSSRSSLRGNWSLWGLYAVRLLRLMDTFDEHGLRSICSDFLTRFGHQAAGCFCLSSIQIFSSCVILF